MITSRRASITGICLPKLTAKATCTKNCSLLIRSIFKHYLVDTGSTYRTTVLRATSKLWGEKRVLGATEPVPDHVNRIISLMEQLEMRAIGVDVIRTDDNWFAVDINPCPSFAQTGLEDALVHSIESSLND